MNTPPNKVRFQVVLEGERRAAGDTAHARTLRHLLKYLLRARSLKCVDAREISSEEEERS
jgi:hypothetical protein